MKQHNFTTTTSNLEDIVSKQFEVLRNDGDIQIGDKVQLSDGKRLAGLRVTYLSDKHIQEGYILIGFESLGGGIQYIKGTPLKMAR